jgi:hypothetical protein
LRTSNARAKAAERSQFQSVRDVQAAVPSENLTKRTQLPDWQLVTHRE